MPIKSLGCSAVWSHTLEGVSGAPSIPVGDLDAFMQSAVVWVFVQGLLRASVLQSSDDIQTGQHC